MRLFGAYKDEMSRLRVSDREIELLLSGQPTGSDELAELENFAQALATASTPPRDPAQMATALAATAGSAARRPIRSGFSRLVVVGATMALLIAMSGIAFAADRAAPGDILYGLDRALERVGIGAGGTDERMAEFETLLRRGDEAAALAFHEKEIEGALTAGTSATSGDQAKGNGGDEPVGASDSNDPSAPDYPETGVDRDGAASPRNGENTPPGQQQTPPGQENTPPGQENTPPGQQQTPPGQENTPPGQENTPPGQENTPPGQENTPPGQENTPPGQDKTPPGQEKTPPGQEKTPPGQDKTPPGQEKTPPGQEKTPPGQERTPPGQEGTSPGQG